MRQPHSYPETFEGHHFLIVTSLGNTQVVDVSPGLGRLLVKARENYNWPPKGQRGVVELEQKVEQLVKAGTERSLYEVLRPVAEWGDARPAALRAIDGYTQAEQVRAARCISELISGGEVKQALLDLCALPGIAFVIASKIYRFVHPEVGAAVDRHSSYFFNSLPMFDARGTEVGMATSFPREWSDGAHNMSRLAVYQNGNRARSVEQYCAHYMPVLSGVASCLNAKGMSYYCPIDCKDKQWRPADIDMAAFYWWQRNGPEYAGN